MTTQYDIDCYIDDAINEGLAKGFEKGLEQGLEKGLQQGRTETVAQLIQVMRSLKLPEDKILEVERQLNASSNK